MPYRQLNCPVILLRSIPTPFPLAALFATYVGIRTSYTILAAKLSCGSLLAIRLDLPGQSRPTSRTLYSTHPAWVGIYLPTSLFASIAIVLSRAL
jgi:hypothetical protein